MDERERACDEEVLRMGSEPEAYAEGILKVCESYLESPLPCVAGVTGANLKKRIEAIMANRIADKLNFTKKIILAAAGMAALAGPIGVGMMNAPSIRAQSAGAVSPVTPVHSARVESSDSPALPAEGARQTLLPEQKSSMSLIAQAAPNQPLSPAPPLTPSRREDPPITMCILIDNSGSMRDKRAGLKAVALALVRASKPYDEVCIVDFNDEAFNELPYGKDFTSDIKEMEEALTRIDSRGGSAMRDAIRMSIDHVEQKAHNDRKVLMLVTDGDDTSSTVTQEQLLGKVKNSGVPIYCIGLLNEDGPGQAGAARLALRQLAEASGGLDYHPKDLAEVERISRETLNEVRKQ
jgi:Mg-chelatase subunit ChlD